MVRVVRVGCLLFMALGMGSHAAEATIMDWMQELSGPGPFNGGGNGMATICIASVTLTYTRAVEKMPCAFFDVRRLVNEDDDNFPAIGKVEVFAYDFGPTWQFGRAFEAGFGGGLMHFKSNNKAFTRPTLVLARFQVKPLIAVGYPLWARHPEGAKWASMFKYYYRFSMIAGRLRAEDFGVSSAQSNFSAKNEIRQSRGVLIDFSELMYHR
jgi:hypothetical protein